MVDVEVGVVFKFGVQVGGDDGVKRGRFLPSSFHRRSLTVTNHLVDSKKK